MTGDGGHELESGVERGCLHPLYDGEPVGLANLIPFVVEGPDPGSQDGARHDLAQSVEKILAPIQLMRLVTLNLEIEECRNKAFLLV